MNFFQKIELENFRNFDKFSLDFHSNCNLLFGKNGSGKTNILEAISLFEKGRGFRKDKLHQMLNKKKQDTMFIINSKYNASNNILNLLLTSELKENKLNKKLLVNGSNSKESLKYFENLYSVIWFLPAMERLFEENPSLRRNFFDRLLYGVDKNYLFTLNKYRKKILERSKILQQEYYDGSWIKQVETEIVDLGLEIYHKRKEYIQTLNNELNSLNFIKNKTHLFNLEINDSFTVNNHNGKNLKDQYLLELNKSRNIDKIIGGCKIGPHKSDISGKQLDTNLTLDLCSTGQQKTFVILIIIAQCNLLIKSLNRQPIVLFDEVCSHLDENNRKILLELINSLPVQIFMTSTEKESFSFLSTKANYYYIS